MSLARAVTDIKAEFAQKYEGNAHVCEVIPRGPTQSLPIDSDTLKMLHAFAKNNPIYCSSFVMRLKGADCTVYEGDINSYWIDSIKHDTSYAPFYPTWILSAYVLAVTARGLGVLHAVDVGSGDGRIAYCCAVAGLKSYGLEIEPSLVELQKGIAAGTGVGFDSVLADATQFEYSSLDLERPGFFIGGLPEVGEILAGSVIEKNLAVAHSEFVLTGTNAARKTSRDGSKWGWGDLIGRFGLKVDETVTLPTRWTMDQLLGTPYVFASRRV